MKTTLVMFACAFSFLFGGVIGSTAKEHKRREWRSLPEAQNVALPDFWRPITGYDSVEMIFFQGKWEPNFCYPNEWEFEKWKISK